MKIKLLSLILIGLLFSLVCQTTVAANDNKFQKSTERVKSELIKLGTGSEARVKVKLRNKTKIKGYVSQINDEGFTIVEDKTNSQIQVSYAKVRQIKGKNNLTGKDIGYIAITVGILFLIILSAN